MLNIKNSSMVKMAVAAFAALALCGAFMASASQVAFASVAPGAFMDGVATTVNKTTSVTATFPEAVVCASKADAEATTANVTFSAIENASKVKVITTLVKATSTITEKDGKFFVTYTAKTSVKALHTTYARVQASIQVVAGDRIVPVKSSKCSARVSIAKAAQPMKVTTVKKSVKKSIINKKSVVVRGALKVTNAKGKVTYKRISGFKAVKINSTTGKITMKKHKCVKSTKQHKIKIKITAAGNSDYKSGSKIVTVTVKMK